MTTAPEPSQREKDLLKILFYTQNHYRNHHIYDWDVDFSGLDVEDEVWRFIDNNEALADEQS